MIILAAAALLIIAYALKNGISPMPTTPYIAREILKILPDEPEREVADLGSGFGTLAWMLAGRYRSVTGYEISPVPYLVSKILSLFRPGIRFVYQDIYTVPLDRYRLIVCYLYPDAMEKLKERFLSCEIGTLILTHTFRIPGWTENQILIAKDLYHTPIYLYKIDETAGRLYASENVKEKKL